MSYQARLRAHRNYNNRRKSMSSFATPAPANDGVNFEDHNGRLLLVEVLGQEQAVKTSFGDKNPIRANVTVLDGDQAGETFEDTLIFPTVLISQLRPRIGEKVLGRLGQGNAKPGQKPPWLLADPTADEIALAEKWVAENTKPTVTSAAAPF
jgi:hypothetical protein